MLWNWNKETELGTTKAGEPESAMHPFFALELWDRRLKQPLLPKVVWRGYSQCSVKAKGKKKYLITGLGIEGS